MEVHIMSDIDDPIARARELAYTASERDAREEKYGVILCDRLAGEEPRYWALWFASREEIGGYLEQSFAWLACAESARSAVAKVAATVIDNGLDAKAMQALNKLATQGFSLLWSGSFDDLCHAQDEVPKLIVSSYRAAREEQGARPVGRGEREDFAEFLAAMKDPD
jgi:hypothetical protein